MSSIQLFIELVQISIGVRRGLGEQPSEKDWDDIFELTQKQSLVGVLFPAVTQLKESNSEHNIQLFFTWLAQVVAIQQRNTQLDEYSAMLTRIFKEWGVESCILKGQGIARIYPHPDLRQAGDIDIWVDGRRDNIVKRLINNCIGVTCIDYVNCHVSFFTDAEVEVHFRPTWMYNPINNRKVQKWIQKNKGAQMNEFDSKVGFGYPTISFNLVFTLIHIYRHVFQEGIGLRQLMDYYFILTHSSKEECRDAFKTLQSFGMQKFVATVMYIMRRVFNIEEKFLLCAPNEHEGEFLLSEILRGGNFGQYDDRITRMSDEHRWRSGLENAKRNLRFLIHYPNEVIWIPGWKLWHWCWRKCNGYL